LTLRELMLIFLSVDVYMLYYLYILYTNVV